MTRFVATGAIATALALPVSVALAHGAGNAYDSPEAWSTELSVILPLLVALAFYPVGLTKLWRRAGAGRGISIAAAAMYFAGIVALVIALISPLDALAERLFSVHMVQHLLLILVAPPLLIAGKPDLALLWALPKRWRTGFGRFERGLAARLFVRRSRASIAPLVIVLLATGTLWLWHVPALYDLAVRNEAVHWAEHVSFLVTSLLFWTGILRLRPHDRADNGLRILFVFGMALQGGLLGALLTFSARPLYTSHLDTAVEAGIAPLVDQQIAGLIMWVPPALLYIGVASWLFVGWLRSTRHRTTQPRARLTST